DGSETVGGHHLTRFPQQTMPYGDVIRAFAERDPNRGYIARITPYAYVAAELLGAKLNILAVYKSAATKNTTYNSYFVVRKDKFLKNTEGMLQGRDPSIEDIDTYLKGFTSEPAKFIYHDRFSTSSYFLPALYFRKHDIFAMNQTLNPNLTRIKVSQIASPSSSDLVNKIIKGDDADLAAVWDGTKKKFESNEDLLFIKIPTDVPNDFLVASGISEQTERLIINAIKKDSSAGRCKQSESGTSPEVPCVEAKDDFEAWYVWNSNDSEVTDG